MTLFFIDRKNLDLMCDIYENAAILSATPSSESLVNGDSSSVEIELDPFYDRCPWFLRIGRYVSILEKSIWSML